ncbi:MAG: protein-export chaperone SecB [Moraxellaceae bacterium]|nr:MAG: protein-export chaperone SecB [Moraxellaceae bacterium]
MAEEQAKKNNFQLQRLYLKDLSYEAPNTPDVFKKEWKPEVNLEVNNSSTIVKDNVHEVVLKVTVTAKVEDSVAFIVEVQQAGLFTIEGIEGVQLEHVLKGVCANILFPYVREVVSDVVSRGTFPQLLLQPINFEAAFAEQIRRQQAQLKGEGEATH